MAEACIQKKAMAEANLPEEIIVNIISRLPVKSLLRFTAVSKRWRSIILFDKQFENELRSANGVGYLPATDEYKVIEEEEDKKNCLSFKEEEEEKKKNGISFEEEEDKNYLSFKEEEEEEEKKKKNGLSFEEEEDKNCLSFKEEEEEKKKNDQKWRSIKGPVDSHLCGQRGTLVNEALHWLNGPKPREPYEIVAFDFAKEEFRKMQLPNYAQDGKDFSYLGVCSGGCLCVSRYPFDDCDSIDFWVMTEYQGFLDVELHE
ncbi:PREDICTED: putative F-box protein At5g62060-like [Fragaria vesca subsp. vesca]